MNNQQDWKRRQKQLLPETGPIGLAPLDIDIVVEQIAHQATVVDIGANGAKPRAGVALTLDGDTVDQHAANLTGLYLIDKIGIGDGFRRRTAPEILEDR